MTKEEKKVMESVGLINTPKKKNNINRQWRKEKTIEDLHKNAEKWFQLKNIPTIISNKKTLVVVNDLFELELSESEVHFRSNAYLKMEKRKGERRWQE